MGLTMYEPPERREQRERAHREARRLDLIGTCLFAVGLVVACSFPAHDPRAILYSAPFQLGGVTAYWLSRKRR